MSDGRRDWEYGLDWQPLLVSVDGKPVNYRVICAWCGTHMEGDESSEVTSHGMCTTCLGEMREIKPT